MTKICARDSYIYPYSPQEIYPLLANIPGYKEWWPGEFHVRILEKTEDYLHSKIEVWASGGWFRCETTALEFPKRIDIQYYQGVVVGNSWWDLEEVAGGHTKVSYCIDLKPNGRIMNVAAKIINISAFHSFQFKRVLKKLHSHLNTLKKAEPV